MIGRAGGQLAAVHAAVQRLEAGGREDAVQTRQGAARGEALTRFDQRVAAREIVEAAGHGAPFIHVAHKDGGQFFAFIQMVEDGAGLVAAAQAGDIQVHADNAQACAAEVERCGNRAARFEGGDAQHVAFLDLNALAHQQGVAVPADAERAVAERDGGVIRFTRDHFGGDGAGARAEAAVGFLKGDNIGANFLQHSQHPRWVAAAIEADAFAHIIAGDFYRRKAGHADVICLAAWNAEMGERQSDAERKPRRRGEPGHSLRLTKKQIGKRGAISTILRVFYPMCGDKKWVR